MLGIGLKLAPKSVMTNANIALIVISEGIEGSRRMFSSTYGMPSIRRVHSESTLQKVVILHSIKALCRKAIMHLLHHVDNFAPTNGPAMMNS
ncbi:hypothetical protein BASA60_000862 [Batrachochytrium salamandrivorans]|nr:hypothetical protein BASA60_000862 [Batrachochytrium salamandrivorans]